MPARLNLFTPLPPQRSEIANHSLVVAEALGELAEVTLWTAQDEPPAIPLDLPVVRFDPAAMDWPRLNQAHATIYNIGNHAAYHGAIYDVARQAPGIVVLHDLNLQHLFAGYSHRDASGRAFYLESMLRTHGPAALADAERLLAGEETLDAVAARWPMTNAPLAGALAVVVHNAAERDALASQTRMPVFDLPLAFRLDPEPRREPAGGGTLRLVMFGFLGSNRRVRQVLDVIAALPDRDVRLDIYGLVAEPEPVGRQIAELGLAGRVALHGYVPEPALRAALLRADLAVNLRYPSMGEASASQLRIWSAGLPSVVTRVGWYAALPADAVFFVEPEREAETLAAHLAALRQDPARFQAAGRRGRALLAERHRPEHYAAALLDIVAQLPSLHARRSAFGLSRKAAQLAMEMAAFGGVALCAEPVGAALSALAAHGPDGQAGRSGQSCRG